MKKYCCKNFRTKALLAFVGALLLASCSDSNDPDKPTPDPGKKYATMLEALKDISVIDSISTEQDDNLKKRFKEHYVVFETYDNYHNSRLLNNYLPNTTKPTLFVYSKDDPWTGARPEHINPQSTRIIINPNGIHNDRIYDTRLYSPEVTKEILSFLRQHIY